MTQRMEVLDHATPVTVEAMREAVRTQVCPWCHRGPFKILLAHLTKFGIDRFQARDMAELPKSADGLTDATVGASLTSARRMRPRPTGLRSGSPKGERRTYSLGGRLAQARKSVKDPEKLRAISAESKRAATERSIQNAIALLERNGYTVTARVPG